MPGKTIGPTGQPGVTPISDEELSLRAADHYNLSADEVETLRVILGALVLERERGGLGDTTTYRQLARLVDGQGIARTLARQAWYLPDLEAFVARVAQAADTEHAAGARFVRGVCAEARGDVFQANQGTMDPARLRALLGL